jgi:F420-non-reducing hydrogenase iron-sulfur subunit
MDLSAQQPIKTPQDFPLNQQIIYNKSNYDTQAAQQINKMETQNQGINNVNLNYPNYPTNQMMQYPPNIRIIRVMCSGRINPSMIFKAYKEGADGVFVGGCHIGDCHYDAGNYKWNRRALMTKDIIEEFGIDKERFRFEWISASEGEKFQRTMKEFYKTISQLGPRKK